MRALLLGCVVAATAAACSTSLPPRASTPEPSPTPVIEPAAPGTPPAVVRPAISAAEPANGGVPVRVLVARQTRIELPQPGRRYLVSAETEGEAVTLRGPLVATALAGAPQFQIGAFARPENAAGVVLRARASGLEADIRTDGTGLSRVVVAGRPGEDATVLLTRLQAAGFPRAVPVPAEPGRLRLLGGEGGVIEGSVLRVVPADAYPVDVGGTAYRGAVALRAAGDAVAVINVLPLESYLRGVVPAEMGPHAFPELEALKAQAVAARTYAVAHLGDHDEEGYDLCATTACQVYRGTAVEHRLSDRAVAETAGEILVHRGRPIDAVYHSTCGGHTEDGANVFSGRGAVYLRGVPCRIDTDPGEPLGPWMGPTERLALVGEVLASVEGVPAEPEALARALTGRLVADTVGGLIAAFGLGEAVTALLRRNGGARTDNVLELLRTFRRPILPPDPPLDAARWRLALVVRLAELAGALHTSAGLTEWMRPPARFKDERSDEAWVLPERVAVLGRRGEQWRLLASTPPEPGRRGNAWIRNGRVIVLELDDPASADAGSAWSWWVRELDAREVAARTGLAVVEDLAVAERGVSGRAVRVILQGGGAALSLGGFELRRRLGLPDSLFVALRRRTIEGTVFRFIGRGWGHGVGLCQNGAYGLARSGLDHRAILLTYYTGVELVDVDPPPPSGGHE